MDKKYILECKERLTQIQCYTEENWLSTIGRILCEQGFFIIGAYSELPRKESDVFRANNWNLNYYSLNN
jgi:hypothetical protein|tara:strand:+ start:84 stop:290 length:207 start_codon:yes stop_codon:yes gene_type:complete